MDLAEVSRVLPSVCVGKKVGDTEGQEAKDTTSSKVQVPVGKPRSDKGLAMARRGPGCPPQLLLTSLLPEGGDLHVTGWHSLSQPRQAAGALNLRADPGMTSSSQGLLCTHQSAAVPLLVCGMWWRGLWPGTPLAPLVSHS